MRRVLLTLFFIITSVVIGVSQENPAIPKEILVVDGSEMNVRTIQNRIKEGDSFYKKGVFDRAYRQYLPLFEMNRNFPALNYKLGVSALYGGKSDEALGFFLLIDSVTTSDHYYYLGKAYQAVMNYTGARNAYEEYYNSLNSWQRRHFQKEYDQLMRECSFGIEVAGDSLPFFIINKGPAVNSYYDEYAAVEFAEGNKIFYTSRRPERVPAQPVHRSSFQERVKQADYVNGKVSEGRNVDRFSTSSHVAVAGFSENENVLYVYSGKRRSGHIRAAQIRDGKISRARRLKGAADRKAFKYTTISISNTGDAYFVSDRPGGYGGKDIWYARKTGKYRFSKAVNIGPHINTPYDEESVYVTPDGNTLYFSSNGHPGYGGFDIYKSKRQPDDTWGEPVNLGYPINGPGHDMFYYPTSDSLVAFISSERPEGFGGLDIYKVVKDTRIPFSLWGEVLDIETGEILPARATLIDLDVNQPVAFTESDSLSGEYYFDMEDVGNFALQLDAPGYRSVVDTLEMPDERNARIRKDYQLHKLLHPYTLWGNITDKATGYPLQAEVRFMSADTDSVIHRVFTDRTSGFYSVTFEDKADMIIEVEARDYYSQSVPMFMSEMAGTRGEKSVELVRSRIIYTLTGIVEEEGTRRTIPARLRISKPGVEDSVITTVADSVSGRYQVSLDDVGPFLMEVNADGYFYVNTSLQFHPDSTLMVRNITMQHMRAGARVVIENILFTTGQATIRAESYSELNKLVRLLKENPSIRIEVSGHTDNVGSASLNRRLSRERALAVKNYLESQGIESGRIEYEGYGFDRPIAPNETVAGRAANRRVEIEVIE